MAGRILFIDQLDNEIMELKLSLEAAGIQVTVQPNPNQAIEDAKVNVPDLVVIEVLTRPVGGLEFASTIALGKHGFTAPVIFYTAFYRDERARRDITEKYGALHYFVKPFQRDALRKAISSVLKQSRHSRSETPPRSRTDSSVVEQSSPSRSETQPRSRTDSSVLEQSSPSRSEIQPRSRPDSSVLEQASPFRSETQPRNRADAPEEVPPVKPVDEIEVVTHSPISEPATPQQVLLVQPPPPELPPLEKELTSLELFKKEPEVKQEVNTETPVAPAKVTSLKLYPKSPKAWAKDDKPKIQTPIAPEKPKPSAPLRVDPKVSPKPKSAGTRTVLPPRPVKKKNWNWAILPLLIFISLTVLYFLWSRFGQPSPNQVKDPTFEADGSNSSEFPTTNTTAVPAESSGESGPMVHKSAAENSTKSPSATPAKVESPPKLPSETGKETHGQNATPSPRSELVVSDMSVSIREPQLVHMKKIALSDEIFGDMGGETFVVRVVIDGKGKVREVTQLKKNTVGASLPKEVLDTIWEWEFRPVAKRQGDFFIKHYSFRVALP